MRQNRTNAVFGAPNILHRGNPEKIIQKAETLTLDKSELPVKPYDQMKLGEVSQFRLQ